MKVQGFADQDWLILDELYWNNILAYVVSDDDNMLVITVGTNEDGEHEVLEVL